MRLSQADAAKSERSPMSVLFLVVLVDMIGIGIIIPFLTYMVADLAPEGTQIGIWVAGLMAAYAAAQFLFSPFWGSLSDRIGRRPVLMIGLSGNTIAFIVFGLSSSLWMALGARLMAGMFNANISVARAYIGDVSQPHEVARRQGMLGVAFGLGFTMGPAIGGLLSAPAKWGWTTAFQGTLFETFPYLLPCLASSLLSFIGLMMAMNRLRESSTPDSSQVPSGRPLDLLKDKLTAIGSMLKRPVISPLLWSMSLYWIAFTIMHVVFILFTMMAVSEGGLGFSELQNGLVFAFIGVVGIITQGGLIGPLTDRFGSSRLMATGLISAGIGLASIPYARPEWPMLSLLLATLFVAFGNGLTTPSNMTLLTHHSGVHERGAVMGVSESLRALSTLAGVMIGGLVWDATVTRDDLFDYHTAFRLCGIFTMLGWFSFRFSRAWRAEASILAAEQE